MRKLNSHLNEVKVNSRKSKRGKEVKSHVCQICDLEFFNEKNLSKHVATHNVKKAKKVNKKEIICSDCDIPFTTMKKLVDHHFEDHTCHLRQCDQIITHFEVNRSCVFT